MFWLALLLFHAAALPSLLASLNGRNELSEHLALLVRIVGMLLTSVFFVLKIADVRWLRLKPGWRSAIAAIAVVGVIHVGVIDRAVSGDFQTDPAHMGLVFFIGSLYHVETIRHRIRLALSILTPVRMWRLWRHDSIGRAWEAVFLPPQLLVVPAFAPPRAPPTR